MNKNTLKVLRALELSELEGRTLLEILNTGKRWFWQRYSLGGFYIFTDKLVEKGLVSRRDVYRDVYERNENRVALFSLTEKGRNAIFDHEVLR